MLLPLPLLLLLLCRNIDYEEFCRMMLTDEHERRCSRQEPKAARNPRSSSPSRAQREPPAADMIPGSMRAQQEGEEGEQLPPMQQQRRVSRGATGSLTAHVLHGVKSGVWDMKAQMGATGFVEERE
jgi:hypothetical protein